MERSTPKVLRGHPIGDDDVFLDGHTDLLGTASKTGLLLQFGMKHLLLANHLRVFRKLGTIDHEE